MIGLVVDSNAQLPPALAERYGVEVVPLTVTVDGVAYLEGVDIDADAFYARFATGRPKVSTAQPSPGQFAAAYEAVADRGATGILSVHIGSSSSGTVNSARLASQVSPVPVRIVDTGTASFAVTLCLWEAAEAVAAGATLEEAAGVAERVGATVGNVFVVEALDIARAGGRLAAGVTAPAAAIPVLTFVGGVMQQVGRAADLDEAADALAGYVRAAGAASSSGLRVGVGLADADTLPLVTAVEDRLRTAPEVAEVVRYRIGPSVGAHTGPGTVGTMFAPIVG